MHCDALETTDGKFLRRVERLKTPLTLRTPEDWIVDTGEMFAGIPTDASA
jgi:hypothetical protein